MAIERWVEEFLWRGRHSGDTAPAGYHVVIGTIGPETLNKPVYTDTLTPELAEAEGFTLGTIIAGINQEALTSRDAALAAQKVAEADRDAKITIAEADRDAARVAQQAAETDRDAKVAAITAERDAAIAALPVIPPGTISATVFQSRFTTDERRSIWALATKDQTGAIGQGLTEGLISQTVDLAAPGLKEWMDALVLGGAITADRETEIMKP